MTRKLNLAAAICLSALTVGAAQAGPIRNNGPITVAGVLGHTASSASDLEGFDDYILVAAGNRILFAELRAAIYQSRGKGHGDHEEPSHSVAASEGGCDDESGPGGTCLQLLDAHENVLCWAERPKHPGWWGGDPHLACVLDYPKGRPRRLTLRVSLADEDCSDLVYPLVPLTDGEEPFALPYLLSVHSKAIASEGPVPGATRRIRDRF
ncbi:MAG: hypothetical protein OEU09_08295 [Rhodospirillales bacterium]|nr:hypothetical protein [Rhodospirillales bacterium]MDH3911283.1 hypothetical protein [Rhodospirillales bacterium]MDH3968624.1 hypothetical protein [Rhodospirillales bacterium]